MILKKKNFGSKGFFCWYLTDTLANVVGNDASYCSKSFILMKSEKLISQKQWFLPIFQIMSKMHIFRPYLLHFSDFITIKNLEHYLEPFPTTFVSYFFPYDEFHFFGLSADAAKTKRGQTLLSFVTRYFRLKRSQLVNSPVY